MSWSAFLVGFLGVLLIFALSYRIPYYIRKGWLDAQRNVNKE